MIDLLRIYEFRDLPLERFLGGQYEGKTIGTVLFEDGSIGFGVKINGKNILNYSDEDLYQYYQSIVGFLNKSILNFSTKVTSATYQFIYIPEFNYDDFIKRILNTNFFETSRENEEAYFNTVNEKIDEIKATLNEFQLFLNTKEYVNSLDEKEIKKLKQDIVRLKNDYEVLLKNFITSSMSIKYLRKFYEALNLRTVELLKSSILGIVRRHRYYLYCRYFPNYKDLNLNFSSVKENVEDIIFSEEESINQYVMNMFTNIVNHAMFLSNSLPFGGIILTIDELVNTMFRYMGMPSLSFNNELH